MLQILHKGIQASLNFDPALIVDDVDTTKSNVAAFKSGVVVGVDANGYVAVADGAAAGTVAPIGFLLLDAAGAFFENVPVMASGKAAVTIGNCVIRTDQYTGTIAAGATVYAGTGADEGLLTSTAPTGARPLGIAVTAGAADGEVEIAAF